MSASTPAGSVRSTAGRLQDRVAIVTGGSSGIGRAISLAYASEGAKVVIADLEEKSRGASESDLTTTKLIERDYGTPVIYVRTDVCSAESFDNAVKRAVEEYGRLDIIVNGAGICPEVTNPQPIWSAPDSSWTSTMAVNTTGLFNGCRAATAQMMAQPALPNGDRGWVVNLSSIYGQTGVPRNVAYCASKHAVLGITKVAAMDCAPHRIRVNAICPGFTETPFTASLTSNDEYLKYVNACQPLKGVGSAIDVARVAVVLASEDAAWITGTAIAVDGGALAM